MFIPMGIIIFLVLLLTIGFEGMFALFLLGLFGAGVLGVIFMAIGMAGGK